MKVLDFNLLMFRIREYDLYSEHKSVGTGKRSIYLWLARLTVSEAEAVLSELTVENLEADLERLKKQVLK